MHLAGEWAEAASWAGRCFARLSAGREAGRLGSGPRGKRESGPWAGFELVWVFLVSFSFSISFAFLFQTPLKLFDLNSTLALKQKEKCTSMNATTNFKLSQILITCEGKLI